MAARFTVEAKAGTVAVTVEVRSISPEMALLNGKRLLTDEHGPITNATVRYSASDHKMTARDFVDEARGADEQ